MGAAFDIGIECLTGKPRREGRAPEIRPAGADAAGAAPGKAFYIETFGCQMNVHDSEKVAGVLLRARIPRRGNSPDAGGSGLLQYVQHPGKGRAEGFLALGDFRKALPRTDKIIGVLGCVAQQEGEEIFERAPWVSLVCGSASYRQLAGTAGATRSGRAPRERAWTRIRTRHSRRNSRGATILSAPI